MCSPECFVLGFDPASDEQAMNNANTRMAGLGNVCFMDTLEI
jgi:hypothetical protein